MSRFPASIIYSLIVSNIERVEPSTELLHTTVIPSPIQSAVSNPVPTTQTLYRQATEVLERIYSQVGESKARYASDISLGSGATGLMGNDRWSAVIGRLLTQVQSVWRYVLKMLQGIWWLMVAYVIGEDFFDSVTLWLIVRLCLVIGARYLF